MSGFEALSRRPWLVVGALAVASFALSLLVGHALFPHLSIDNDEPIYLLQASVLRHGHLTLSASAHRAFFRPWMSGEHGGRLFLVVQPVLPALLAVTDLLFGSMRIGLALIAAGAVVSVYAATRHVVGDEIVALAAAALFALSPLVIVQSALFLTYLLAVLLACAVIVLIGSGVELRSRFRLVAGGVVFGLLSFTRPIEGLMLGFVVVVWIATRDGLRSVVRSIVPVAVGVAPIVVLVLLYNRITTGNPLRFPLWAIGGNDAFGFGNRSAAPGAPIVRFGPGEAWLTLRTNLRALPHWLFGGLVTLPILVWGAICLWRTKRSALLLLGAIAVVYPMGYFFYWGHYLIIAGRNFIGPHYYLGLLLPSVALIAAGATDLVRRHRAALYLIVPLLVLGTSVEVRDKIDANVGHRDRASREVQELRSTVRAPAVVVVPASQDGPYILHPRGFLANSPDLSDATLYAADLMGRNAELFDRYPNRSIYRLQVVDDGHGSRPDVRQLLRVRTNELTIPIVTSSAPSTANVTVYVADDGHVLDQCTLANASAAQSERSDVRVTATTVAISGCQGGAVVTGLPSEPSTLSVGVSRAAGTDLARRDDVEQRYWLRPRGDVLDCITPPDTWRRSSRDGDFRVVTDESVDWVRFDRAR